MSEKTEKPTPKKIRDARKKGQVAKSAEITSGIQLVVLLGYFCLEGPALWQAIQQMIEVTMSVVNHDVVYAVSQWLELFVSVVIRFLGGLAALMLMTTIAAIVGQIGPLLATEALQPSLKKLNLLDNLKQMFSMQNLFEFIKSIFKVTTLSLIFYYLLHRYSPSIQFLPLHTVAAGVQLCVRLLFWMMLALIGFYVIFGIADFAFQRYNNTKKLMMSLEDIKQEHKNSEGNPEIKHKRKEVHREIQSGSLAKNVAKSTVVVRNPTHVAVCLFYHPDTTPLPQVIETGYDKRALHIIRLAEKSGIPTVENIDVARALARGTPVGGYIPPDLFEPVAHILRLAMNLHYDDDEDDYDES
ncbi:EscU/YscU/HrcU family type III secretion system export apparatus switch protein [Aeromonas salmonicida]|uniref:EscU/YscU/HrcU family type III secretion system export apparatus switch protein n=1 Tax=Aeromonas salmonicida TaxID=645 RepID=UPI00259E56E3|nr:EscU/YscU/HrcU family type III secretion system export apparatus switch protein [Aeromonas salmonicida]MDM5065593.1 EscU/YscU/HrcU family type III secretion system export apparatus switch protein [Aeromonas salmonicida]